VAAVAPTSFAVDPAIVLNHDELLAPYKPGVANIIVSVENGFIPFY
jgi:hypothetical protein